MLILLAIALGVVLLASASKESEAPNYDPSDPMGSWKKSIEENTEPSSNPLPASGASDAEAQAWIDYYKSKFSRVAGTISALPPEFPQGLEDLGPEGDLDKVGTVMREEIVYALFAQDDPHTLQLIADEIESAGFQVAANRLREKSIRVVAYVGSPETSPMPEASDPDSAAAALAR